MATVLIVEDDDSLREVLTMQVEDLDHRPLPAATVAEARRLLADACPDVVLLDHQLPDGLGLDLLKEIKGTACSPPVVMVTGVRDTQLAIQAMQEGAYDFIRKPMDVVELTATLNNVLAATRLSRQVATLNSPLDLPEGTPGIIGESQAIIDIAKTIGKVAGTDATVLITGESGTGKEVIARAIHHYSGRAGLFLPVNCAAIVETLLESELFGHEKGSFTGAVARKEGKFEVAEDGTLFLDEIGELPLGLQAKLLRVLQEKTFVRVGGNHPIRSSARIVAATNRDLRALVEEKRFRDDLYFRLNVITIHLPPLRERLEDLAPLVDHLLNKIAKQVHKPVPRLTEDAWKALAAYPWPGNIRELENVLTRALILAPRGVLTAELFGLIPRSETPAPGTAATPPAASKPALELVSLEQLEQRHIQAILKYTRWNKGKTCEILSISRPTLERKIEKYHLS